MSYFNDPNVLRQIIMDHYEYPRNRHLVDESKGYQEIHMNSESCIDDIKVQLKMNGDIIEDVCFDGEACTISTASTSIMTELVIGKTVVQTREIIANYLAMVNEEPYDEELLEEAIAFKNVSAQANRIKCATIGWNALAELLDEENRDDK